MSTSKKFLCSGAVLLSCLPLAGCAGNRLNNMFSTTSPSDYKTLQELAEEERQQSGNPESSKLASLEAPKSASSPTSGERWARFPTWKRDAKDEAKSTAAPANTVGEIVASEPTESAGPLEKMLAFGSRKKGFETDPFLETDAVSREKSAAVSKSAEVQSESERLAELDRLRELQNKKSLQAAASGQKSLQDSVDDPAEEAERLFADASKILPASTAAAATGSNATAKIRTSAKTNTNPADELEALLSRSESLQKTEATDGKLQLASAQQSPKSDENYTDMFRALQAGFETPGAVVAGKSTAEKQSAVPSSNESENPFDRLLADSAPASAASDAKPRQSANEKSGNTTDGSFEGFLKTATPTNHLRRNRLPVRKEVVKVEVPIESEDDVAEKLWAAADAISNRPNPFEQSGLAEAKPLADADFPWKSDTESSFATRNANDSGQQWWNNSLANSGYEVSDQNFLSNSSAARNSAMDGTLTTTSSLSRNPGYEDAPPFNPVSFQTEFSEGTSASAGVVAAVNTAPVVSVTGPWKLNSFRNWLLLIGGIVVAILLFAPKRTKPVHAVSTNTHARN